ncbi:MAG: hypothetical protein Tsb0020_46400 [Haliangiales bacterium]
MRSRYRVLCGAAAALIGVYVAISWLLSSMMVRFDVHTLESDRQRRDIDSPAQFGLPAPLDVTVPGAGVSLAGWLFVHPERRGCGAIISHGHTGTRYGGLDYAPLFWRRGCDLLLFDARYHGHSGGEFGTYGVRERDDLVAAVDWFARERGLSRGQIALLGESMGAAITLQAAAKLPDVAFVAVDSAFASLLAIFREQGQVRYGWVASLFLPAALALASWRAGAPLEDAQPIRYAPEIAVPVLLIHARADGYIAWTNSRDLYEAIAHPRKALHVLDGDISHGQTINRRPDEYERYFADFLRTYAPDFGAGP